MLGNALPFVGNFLCVFDSISKYFSNADQIQLCALL